MHSISISSITDFEAAGSVGDVRCLFNSALTDWSFPIELGAAIVATIATVLFHTRLMSFVLPGGLLWNLLRVPAVLIATCGTFPIINMAFPPHHLALLYVVGNRMQPSYNDGDVMVTVSSYDRLRKGDIVLHRNNSNGGIAFDGLQTPIRLRKVLLVTESNITIRSDSRGVETGDQVVTRSAVLAKAVLRVPHAALPLRYMQWATHSGRMGLAQFGKLDHSRHVMERALGWWRADDREEPQEEEKAEVEL